VFSIIRAWLNDEFIDSFSTAEQAEIALTDTITGMYGYDYVRDDYEPVTGWLTTTEGSQYWFDKDGFRVSNKWVQIDGKWYYFNSDGKLAVSATIDGYEVGADGARK